MVLFSHARWPAWVPALALLLLAAPAVVRAATPAKENPTLANLQAAYNGEANAHAGYMACAQKADEEGYAQVASLFRAAARSEEIHAANHAKVIKKLGAEPKADVKTPEVKSTRENLQEAVADESHERDQMYPDFIQQARAAGDSAAVRTFTYAQKAEAEHAKLFQSALDNLDQWKGGKKDFYVCKVCGYTAAALPEKKCPSCTESVKNYEKVNYGPSSRRDHGHRRRRRARAAGGVP